MVRADAAVTGPAIAAIADSAAAPPAGGRASASVPLCGVQCGAYHTKTSTYYYLGNIGTSSLTTGALLPALTPPPLLPLAWQLELGGVFFFLLPLSRT